MTSRIGKFHNGFTLVELVVVITIIGIIVAAGTLSYSSSIQQANDEKMKSNIEQIRISLELYRRNKAVNNQYYPASLGPVVAAGHDIPVHPISNDIYGYNYLVQPTTCFISGVCTSYILQAEIEGGNATVYATPLEVRIIRADEPTMTPLPTLAATRTPTPSLVPPTRTPTPTTGAWSTPIPHAPTSTPIPRPTLAEYNCASCTTWSQFSQQCGAAVGCPTGQASYVCIGHINCVACRTPDVSCAPAATVAPTNGASNQ
ncbi:prepilin-type N-terminal cleavage/methylation domain-containing protein [Candidatus Woesebacteria bacterium]|nr:prepilin-type N-terminal cleavage/methylation domain-containing protein [Candidatus Woesebacteria bacterium]